MMTSENATAKGAVTEQDANGTPQPENKPANDGVVRDESTETDQPKSPDPQTTDDAEAAPVEAAAADAGPPDAPPADSAAPPAETPAGAQADESSAAEGPLRRRLRLNPTVAAEKARPVPTMDPAAPPSAESPADSEQPAAEDAPAEAGEQPAAPAPVPSSPANTPPPRSAPVEIPRTSVQLDSETEAEIAAAMASGELESANNLPEPSAVESEEAPEKPESEEELESGLRLTGKIQQIHGEDVFLDIGYRSPGIVTSRQFESARKPEIGQIIEVVVDRYDAEEGLILLNLPRGVRRPTANWDAVVVGQTVDCTVVQTNKGGLEVNVGNLRGFMPASQVDVGFVSDLETFVGQRLSAEVTEVNPKKRRLVVSRRSVLMIERKEREKDVWREISVGQTCPGVVKTIKNYGAFVDIGGVDGFLHIGEISHSRIRHPSDVLAEGQQIQVQILSLDEENRKIGLGMKQLIADPWAAAPSNYPAESSVSGKVTRIADFGAFVELEPGIEGLVHISEIDHTRIARVADALKVGQTVEAKVLEVDPDRNRISLSIKAMKARPDSPKQAREEPAEPYERRHKGPLKGGTSDTLGGAGGLFGNPNDFTK